MRKIGKIDPTTGKIVPSILWFAFPIALGTLLQTLFNACDLIVVRMSADSVAVASVGATGTVTTLFVSSMVGVATGVNIVLARFIGAKENGRARRFISTAIVTAIALGVLVAVLGVLFGDDVLRMMNCPEDCFEGACTYIIVYVISAPFILLYNFAATIIRVSGDSIRPMFYLIYAGVANVVLNLFFCWFFEDKVLAVALATVIAQVLGAVFCMIRLLRTKGACGFSFRHLSFDFSLCRLLFRYGIPGAVTNATFAISNLLVQGAINSFGSSVVAGNAASNNIESLVSCITTGITSATSVFIGQNIGAKQPDRVKKTVLWGIFLNCSINFVVGLIVFLFRNPLIVLFVGDDALAMASANARMNFVLQFYVVYSFRNILKSSVGGFGYSRFTMIESLVAIVLFRVVWMSFIYPLNPCMEMAYATYLVSSVIAILISGPMLLYVSYRYFKKGIATKI